MSILLDKSIAKKYWITWVISSVIGLMMLNISLSGPHLCSPVVGCGPEVPMLIAITISIILILFRAFKKNKLKLITPLILLVTLTPSLIIFVIYFQNSSTLHNLGYKRAHHSEQINLFLENYLLLLI